MGLREAQALSQRPMGTSKQPFIQSDTRTGPSDTRSGTLISGEVGGREEREREGEGQVGGALEAELDDGESQEIQVASSGHLIRII